jgi:hypothetical protein
MTSETWFPVFADADVLAAPLTRTLLILCGIHRDGCYGVRWSLAVEAEADRHLRPGQTPVRALRERFDWGSETLVAEAAGPKTVELPGTSPKDRHVVWAAAQAGIAVIVSRNVTDFGHADLARLGISAVHPDLFLSSVVTAKVYQDTLASLAKARTRQPNTPETLHAAIGAEHPRLHKAMSDRYPGANAAPSDHRPPGEESRGAPWPTPG